MDLDDQGLILTDMGLQTSVPRVFAAGDVRSGSTKQLASAVGEGAAAAIGIRMYLERLDAKPMHVMRSAGQGDPEECIDGLEIFELIIKADEKLKYAHEDNAGLRRQQARDLLARAREAATEIGNDALVQQADTRLADLAGPEGESGSAG